MNRVKLKRALVHVNIAVWIGAATFLPRHEGVSFTFTSETEREIKRVLFSFPWLDFLAVCGISLFLTTAIYGFIDALKGETPGGD